jgi:hypothetical protein
MSDTTNVERALDDIRSKAREHRDKSYEHRVHAESLELAAAILGGAITKDAHVETAEKKP